MNKLICTNQLVSIEDKLRISQSLINVSRKDIGTVINCGKELIKLRDSMQGEFTRWLHSEFQLSSVLAYHYIHVAERFPDVNNALVLGKYIPLTVFYIISSPRTPKRIYIEVVNKAQSKQKVTLDFVNQLKKLHTS